MPEIIDVLQSDDLRDVAHRAVACLARGGVVALATDAGYGLVASLADPGAIARMGEWLAAGDPGQSDLRPVTLLVKGAGELADWADLSSPSARRLAGRVWPGPVVLRLRALAGGLADRLAPAVRAAVVVEGWVSAQSPADRLTREILRLTAGPLLMVDALVSAAQAERPISLAPADFERFAGLEMILDAGDPPPGSRPTTVAVDGSGWSVVHPGVVPETQIEEWAGTIILFVCTGNTCRSPMAEALCKAVLARRVGCSGDDLARHGFVVRSAGVAASFGLPAASNAVEVVRGRGGSLADHFSRPITADLVRHADHILAMTWDHLDALLDQAPEAGHRVRLLDPAGEDIPDPIGQDEPAYRETARVIERHLEHLLAELGL